MTNHDASEPPCERCRNFEASDDHWHLPKGTAAALISVIVTVLLAGGGWVWFLSNQTADARSLDRRVTAIEARDDRRDDAISDIRDRLARIETSLKLLTDHIAPDRAAR